VTPGGRGRRGSSIPANHAGAQPRSTPPPHCTRRPELDRGEHRHIIKGGGTPPPNHKISNVYTENLTSSHWVSGSLYYLMMGAFFALVTLRDNRLELAIGAHAANNLFVALLVNPGQSGMPTQAVWQTIGDHSLYGLFATGVIAAIFYGLLVKKPRVLIGPDREAETRRFATVTSRRTPS
jgi:hypothetical protein